MLTCNMCKFYTAVGRAWINVVDYVDKGQLTNANLDKGGYIKYFLMIDTIMQGKSNIYLIFI